MDKSWEGWTKDNLGRGCDPKEILDILIKNNFSMASIRKAMGDLFPADSPLLGEHAVSKPEIDYKALTRVRLTTLGPEKGVVRLEDPRLQLYTVEKFMSEEECDKLVAIIHRQLRPSTVTVSNGDKYFRTSTTSDLSTMKHKAIDAIDEKIARKLGIRLPYSEGVQAQKYEVGQEFKPHTDYFQPGTPEYEKFAGARGNRTWTFMVYLNDTPKGGGTQFVNIGKTFYPKKGNAVVWNNLCDDGAPNADTKHCGMPVEEGDKVIITKWFRERGAGPMFYGQK